VRVLDYLIVAGSEILSIAECGLILPQIDPKTGSLNLILKLPMVTHGPLHCRRRSKAGGNTVSIGSPSRQWVSPCSTTQSRHLPSPI
jgi:hypothetical protein